MSGGRGGAGPGGTGAALGGTSPGGTGGWRGRLDPGGAGPGGTGAALGGVPYAAMLCAAAVAVAFVFVLSISVGIYRVPFGDVVRIIAARFAPPAERPWAQYAEIAVNSIRLPRAIAALLIGGGLASAGAAYQSMFKNPMVSPDILGVSAGASVGAALAIFLGSGMLWIELGAFLGGVCAVLAAMAVPKAVRNDSVVVLVLAGIIVGSLASSAMSVIRMMADPATTLADITYWTMGSLTRAKMSELAVVGPVMLACMALLVLTRYRLNVLSLGESEARMLGVDVRRQRALVVLCSTLLTACSVSIAGTIGWVGLVVPHITRVVTGPDNKRMLPMAILFGAAFMMLVDMLARSLAAVEIPLSVLTGIIGSPVFFAILLSQRRRLQ